MEGIDIDKGETRVERKGGGEIFIQSWLRGPRFQLVDSVWGMEAVRRGEAHVEGKGGDDKK